MSIVYKDIDTYTPKSSIAGTEKIPVSSSEYITPNQITASLAKGNGRLFYGTCATAAGTAAKVVTCSSFTSDDLVGALLLVEFDEANTATASNLTLNVNGTGAAKIMKIYNGEYSSLTAAGEIRRGPHLFTYRYVGEGSEYNFWVLIGADYNNSYTSMTQAQLDAGTGTTGYRMTPKLLRDNFYTEDEVDAFFTNRPTIVHLADESDMPATPDANTIYMIDES